MIIRIKKIFVLKISSCNHPCLKTVRDKSDPIKNGCIIIKNTQYLPGIDFSRDQINFQR